MAALCLIFSTRNNKKRLLGDVFQSDDRQARSFDGNSCWFCGSNGSLLAP
jgi:hypothetical protein